MRLLSWRGSVLLAIFGASWQFGQELVFKDDVKLVEVYATVLDRKGREIYGLTKDQFEIRDEGKIQRIRVFEPAHEAISCALLLDTTGSMTSVMPTVRNAACKLIDSSRPNDLVSVFTFTDQLEQLQEPTTDHSAAKRVLGQLHTAGRTALFDSLTQLAIDMERKPGKKAIIVLTDGGDNTSVLEPYAAAGRIKNAGVPVFVIAEGNALHSRTTTMLLRDLADTTGGSLYLAHHSKDINGVFEAIGRRMRTGYLLGFTPAEKNSKSWHEIQVLVRNVSEPVDVKARAGYSFQ